MENCISCKFYQNNQCLRYPEPIAKKPTDFCGEFKPLSTGESVSDGRQYITDSEYGELERW